MCHLIRLLITMRKIEKDGLNSTKRKYHRVYSILEPIWRVSVEQISDYLGWKLALSPCVVQGLGSTWEEVQKKITRGRGMALFQGFPVRGGNIGGSKSVLHRWDWTASNMEQSEERLRLRRNQRKKTHWYLIFIFGVYRHTCFETQEILL